MHKKLCLQGLPDSHALPADTGRIQHPDHTHMHKKLCLQGLVATEVPAEVSRVEDVYFFTDFNMIEISRLLDGSITTDVEVYYRVPWYLIFLKANINAYLKQSIQDRLRIMYQALQNG